MTFTPTDHAIVEAMRVYGGSFVQQLAVLCDKADPVNLAKIKATWAGYWAEYAEGCADAPCEGRGTEVMAFQTFFKHQTEPRIVGKITKRRKAMNLDRTEKEKVRQRDKESCRVCGRKTRDVHERLFKSRGGLASLDNSICACRKCHPFLQEHGITVLGPTCNGPLHFLMNAAVAKMIFGSRATPKHVEVGD